ncbi:hypothetical protein [Ornithinibacillus halophilus]|uniref:Galactose-1-phosphate uridylyltransferase n=1 Tax=Ornithinibacillus halophilus TaxID=930117 RepID=A0A1M5MCG2_9BACI|nr:hypothetical protein [Ornithinibacillus halophilus]SHG75000.1 Galactose-1-phosphate uridylyltransferase [Ornithinibacillus halophilus]
MDTLFQKHEEFFVFYDGEGNKIERKTEIRYDPLTGESSRIVFDPGMDLTPPDYTQTSKQTSGKNCPFCKENILKMTPIFPDNITPNERVTHGQATLFPNLFPYSKHNGVAVFSEDHYVKLADFTVPMIRDAFIACQKYIQSVLATEEKEVYVSINWNYLPYSGGSILHPHLHVIISESATNYQSQFERKSRAFKENHDRDYLNFLYEHEKNGERWIGEHGDVAWIHSFSPKGHNDFQAIFRERTKVEDLSEDDWTNFAKGLKGIFATLDEQGLASFNMGLTFSNEGFPVHARLIPRLVIGGLDTSDFNYFQVIHHEPLSYKVPEKVAELARKHF